MKKILSLILAGLMTVSCAAFVAADDAAVEAADPNQSYAISFLAQHGIYHGKSSEEFVAAADEAIERYQMALFVARISTGWVDDYMWDYNYDWEDNTANNSTFDDLAGTAAENYYGAISYANQKGIIEGYSTTKFGPTDGITYRDALTMVVRTLGYQGLSYPWGYIEKAVELGLTEGVDAVYTDALTRGEVAVILYNAMFAPTKSGETLAKSIFGVEFGWENIVIVATDEGGLNSNGLRSKTGFVAFKLLNDNGTLDSKVYYAKSADLGLEGHEEEIEIGAVYAALFTIDGDLATIEDAASLNFMTVINNGLTDNEGVAYETLPIQAAIKAGEYIMEDEFTKDYVSYFGNELLTYVKDQIAVTSKNDKLVGIDVTTNNIMTLTATGWEAAWLYNATLDKYYQYTVDNGNVYINWMSDAEFVEWYEKVITVIDRYETEYVLKADYSHALDYSAYAKLRMYDIDADAVAEIATLKTYGLGVIANETEWCGSCNANKATYTLYTVEGGKVAEVFVEAGHTNHDTGKEGFAWINAEGVTGFVNEDGSINGGVVVYDYNKTTGEIEVVKYVTKEATDDADSYIFTGILQAYSTKGATITVDGEKYAIDYNGMLGTTLNMCNDRCIACRSSVATELDQYLMQYVTVTLIDNVVVDVDLLNDTADVIVVLDYAGISSDGYICVYGYSTADPVLKIFKINSYNGWKRGDYKYYPENAFEDSAFVTGAIYNIKSYDPETESYGVTTQNIEDIVAVSATFKATYESNYRIEVLNGVEKVYAANDTYIIIDGATGMIYVKTGVKTGYIDGKVLNRVNDNKFVVWVEDVNAEVTNAAGNLVGEFVAKAWVADVLDIGFILYDKDLGRVLEAAYDDTQIGDWYLLGATTSELRAFNLLTGKDDYVYTTANVDLVHGCVYMTIGNMVVRQVSAPGFVHNDDFIGAVTACYTSGSQYKFGFIDFTSTTNLFNLVATNICGITNVNGNVYNKRVADTVKEIVIFDVDNNVVLDAVDYDAHLDVDVDLTALGLEAGKIYHAFVVYNASMTRAIIYVASEKTQTLTTYTITNENDPIVLKKWDYVDGNGKNIQSELIAEVVITVDGYEQDGKYYVYQDTFVLETLTLRFTNPLNLPHGDLAVEGLAFGVLNDHDASFFYANDSRVDLSDGTEITADDMVFNTLDDCNMVNEVVITIGKQFAGVDVPFTFYVVIDGQIYDENGTLVSGSWVAANFELDAAVEWGASSTLWELVIGDNKATDDIIVMATGLDVWENPISLDYVVVE